MPFFFLDEDKIEFPDPKLALVLLARDLKNKGAHMIDCQFHTDFLESMGGEYISYDEYMELINKE